MDLPTLVVIHAISVHNIILKVSSAEASFQNHIITNISAVKQLNKNMTTSDQNTLAQIYESLNLEPSFDNDYDSNLETLKVQFNNNCHSIERMLRGTIAYYKYERAPFLSNPSDMNSFESIAKLEKSLRPLLSQLYNFT